MTTVCKSLFLLGIFLPLFSCRRVPFFRRDYVYNEDLDAFYKVHWNKNGFTWDSAFLTCDDEGAALFYPRVTGEFGFVKDLIYNLKEMPNVSEIFVGIHDTYRLGNYITVDGHATTSPLMVEEPDPFALSSDNCILMHLETGNYKRGPCEFNTPVPFVCKKVENEPCPTIDRDYKYVNTTRKCYKVIERERVWDDAMRTCYLQGGVLTVIETEEEAYLLRNFLTREQTYHTGFRRNFLTNELYSVKGQNLNEMFHRVQDDRYNGYINVLNGECGGVFCQDYLYLTSHDCNRTLPFICEMQANM